jgi:ABC-type glutathione transport system ATPase component
MAPDPLLRIRGLGTGILRDIDLDLVRGRTLGLVGPSGSGKSTLARAIALFEPPARGEILLDGRNLWQLSRRDRTRARAEVQLIFQEPAATLNPRFTAAEIVTEPLRVAPGLPPGLSFGRARAARNAAAAELLETVGLPRQAARRHALEFSGGERQRLAIARALALQPKLLILDESFSGLDLSIQAQIANLLLDLQQRRGLTSILISHDLALAASLAGEIAVMDQGTIVECAPTAGILAAPRHPRTRELLEAARALAPAGIAP